MLLDTFIQEVGQPSMEAIDFQFGSSYLDRLIKAIDEVRPNWNTSSLDNSNIPKVLKEISGLTIKLKAATGAGASVQFPKARKNHPLYEDWMKDYTSESAEHRDLVKTGKMSWGIDLSSGRISGSVTEYRHDITLGRGLFAKNSGYKTDELAAVLLHELGHLVTFYEWAYRQSATNFLLTHFSQTMVSNPEKKQKFELLKAAQDNGLLRGVDKEVYNAKTVDQMRVIIYASEVNRSRTDLGTDVYDARNWEALADQYVTRMGLGKQLAFALQRLGSEYASAQYRRWIDVIGEAIGFIMLLVYTWFSLIVAMVGLVFTPIFIGLPMAIMYIFGAGAAWVSYLIDGAGNSSPGTYDLDKQRLKVIRKELIGRLKDAPDSISRKLVSEEVKALDGIIDEAYDQVQAVSRVTKIVFPNERKRYRSLKVQQLLEDLSNSELHQLAAEIED